MPREDKQSRDEIGRPDGVLQKRKDIFARATARPSFAWREIALRRLLEGVAYMTVAVTLAIVVVLFYDAINFFRQASLLEFFTGTVWAPFGEPRHLGMLPLLGGTLMISFGASMVAVPLGLGTAIYLTQYASYRVREAVMPVVEVLGGIPTVVYGYFALTAVTPFLQSLIPGVEVFNALAASIVVGIGMLPLIASLTADALRLVPPALQQAGYALGMRRHQVIIRIVLPAAASGIVAAILLGFARAIGETMAVTLAAGATPNLSWNYLQGIQTITAFIVQISLGDTPAGSLEYYTIYALGLVLFVLTFSFNYLAGKIVQHFREVYE